MKRTHQDILGQTVISSNKLLPHLVTFMGQGNHMAHAAGSRSTPTNSMLVCLTLIILKDGGVPISKVFHHPYSPNASNSLSMTKLPSFLVLLTPFSAYWLSCLVGGIWFSLCRHLSRTAWWGEQSLQFMALTDVCIHIFILLFIILVTELHNICCL